MMERCEKCDISRGFRSFVSPIASTGLPNDPTYKSASQLAQRDSRLVQDAFGKFARGPGKPTGLADLPVEHADLIFSEEEPSLYPVETALSPVYGYRQPNCFAAGLRNGIRGAVVGSAFGGALALSAAVQNGYRGTAAASYVGMSVRRNAVSFGSWTGLYGFSRCSMIRMRQRHDLLNPTIAGAFTGGVLTLIYVRGHWRYNQSQILVNAAGSAMIAVMFEALNYM